jgi:hypothetical protein
MLLLVILTQQNLVVSVSVNDVLELTFCRYGIKLYQTLMSLFRFTFRVINVLYLYVLCSDTVFTLTEN